PRGPRAGRTAGATGPGPPPAGERGSPRGGTGCATHRPRAPPGRHGARRSPRSAATSSARGLGTDAVVQDQERQPEDPEGMLGPELVVADVDVELLGEAMD